MSGLSDRELRERLIQDPASGWRAFVDQFTPTLLQLIERCGVRDRDDVMDLYVHVCERLAADAGSFFEAQGGPPGTGQLLLAIDPSALGGAEAEARIGALAAAFEGNGDARLPGRRRQATAARIRADGIEVDAALMAEIEALGR